ncbi:MAG TPA: hypothetical protein VHM24_00450 [Gemmatimonadaceae bacterium]|nr:hypothetical protein [Gemmatimonadaceae bacterium]
MHPRLWIAAAVAATPILALSPVAFPSGNAGCVKGAPGARYNQRLFVSLMRRRDDIAERTLAVYNVLRVKSHDVKAVNDPALCTRAAAAYNVAVKDEEPGRKVHILRVGDRYIVMDPDYRPDDYHRAVTFDSTFTRPLAMVME